MKQSPLNCWKGYERVPGTKEFSSGSCKKSPLEMMLPSKSPLNQVGITTTGYRSNSPDVDNDANIIPSSKISMKDVDFPVKGVGSNGTTKNMQPEKDYDFGDSDYVIETPLNRVAKGGMSAKERKAYNNETGGDIKAPQPEGGPRKKSYCARSAGIKKCKDPDENGDCPNDIARRNWKC